MLLPKTKWPEADLRELEQWEAGKADVSDADSPERRAYGRLLDFTELTFPKYEAAQHHRDLCAALEAVEEGGTKRLLVTMAPRHGKSELVSIRFPAWYLGRNPDKRVILASYGGNLAQRFSRSVRNLLSEPIYSSIFPTVSLSQDSKAVDAWDLATPHRGGMVAAGIGGGLTGHGADLFVIDDPLKDRRNANSPLQRDRDWEWYASVARTRLEDNAAVVLVLTRWHDDDLAGRVLKQSRDDPGADQWDVMHLPAINEAGEALWPEKYPLEELQKTKATIGAWEFAAQYQGDPQPEEGAIFYRDWFQRIERLPHHAECTVIQAWDTAFEEGQDNDYSACVTLGLLDNRVYLLNVWRERVEFPDLIRAIQTQAQVWKPNTIMIEDSGSGKSSRQHLSGLTMLPILPVRAGDYGNKATRARKVTPWCEAGKVWLPSAASWLASFEEELYRFPSSAHDDQVDAFVYAMMRAMQGSRRRKVHK